MAVSEDYSLIRDVLTVHNCIEHEEPWWYQCDLLLPPCITCGCIEKKEYGYICDCSSDCNNRTTILSC